LLHFDELIGLAVEVEDLGMSGLLGRTSGCTGVR
jgi:hypothetical protein